jgi:hypothetical protein
VSDNGHTIESGPLLTVDTAYEKVWVVSYPATNPRIVVSEPTYEMAVNHYAALMEWISSE